MQKFKRLCAVLVALTVILSSMSGVFGVLASAETETEAVTITESAREHLREQMRTIYTDAVAAATETGTTVSRDSALNKIISITQSDPWHVYGTTAAANSWSDTKGYYRRYDSSSSLDLRYGHSDWSYTTASIRVSYKGGSASNGEALTALLRPDSDSTDSRKNAYIGLYYVAEVSGEYYISDNFGGFIVRSTAASGYNAYITILANGEEIYKSIPLSRDNRMAKFDGATVELQKGEKIEYRFTYEGVADNYGGDIEFDFDPQISLLSQTEDIVLEGTGEVSQVLYNALDLLEASGTNKSVAVAQTAVWRAQMYSSSSWKDLTYYCTHSKQYDGGLDWGYDEGSYSQTDRISIKYKDSTVSNGLFVRTRIPMTRWNMKQARLAYTAEREGTYTLTDKFGEFLVSYGALTQYDYWIQITHNDTVLWKSDILANKGETAKFDGVTVDMVEGDILAIEFRYSKKSTATETYDTTRIDIDYAPVLTYVTKEKPVSYTASDAYNELFADFNMAEGDAAISGTLTQPTQGWTFDYGKTVSSLTALENYYYSGGDIYWGQEILNYPSYSGGSYPGVYINIGLGNDVNPAKGLLYARYRGCVQSGGIQSSHQYAKDFAYTFIAPKAGNYKLSELPVIYQANATVIADVIVRIYKNGTLLYSSNELTCDNTTVTIPEQNYILDKNDEISILFERQNDTSVHDWNNNLYIICDPTITYIPAEDVVIEKDAYTPVKSERYYAENITAPVSISAYVKTNEILGGAIVSSDDFTLDIASNGYPRITLNDGSEIIFPVDVRGESFNHIAVVYNSEAGEWYLYFNGVKATTVVGAGISADTISKLYVGASADKYNNSYFKGSISELALFSTALTDDEVAEIVASGVSDAQNYWALSDAQTELSFEEISVSDYDKDDNGIAFTSQNQRLDLYKEFDTPVNTFEAWVRLETAFIDSADAGVITSSAHINDNTVYGSAPCVTLRIGANGKPELVIVDSASTTTTITFNTDIRSDDWVHLAITADYDAGYYYCYINGQLVDKQAATGAEIPVTIRPYVVNGNYFNQSVPYYFQGDIAGVSMFSDARTQSEILDDIYGVDIDDADLLGSWYIDDALEDQPNRNGDGNDLHAFWASSADEVVDESFGNYSTFIMIPDTQYFTQNQGAAGISTISNWILENKETENIVGVMGLGDITNLNTTSQWAAAAEGFEPLKGQIPFVFVGGNHDIEFKNPSADNPRDVTNFNTYFPYADWEPYMSGFYEEGKIDNMYYLLEDVNGVKYMMLGLEFQPRDAVLQWANEVVASHPDYKVIVATHGYQNYDYATNQNYYISSNGYEDVVGTDSNVGTEIWEKFASQHENIQAVFCGHVKSDVHYTTNTGVNGNTVTEIIANAQSVDSLMRMSGMILILRVSEDGTKANINYYSPYHDHYLRDLNQFNIDWIEKTYVAEINGVKYETLAEAVAAANAGDTVTLLCDTEGAGVVIDKDITIDFGGHTYTITSPVGSTGTVSNGLQLLQGNNITLMNGTLKVADEAKNDFYILVQNYSNLTVTDMVLDGTNLDKYSLTDGDSYTLSNNCGDVNIDGATSIIANDEGDKAFAFDVCKYATYDAPVVTVNTTGEINGNIEVTAQIADNLSITAGIFNTDVTEYLADGTGIKLIDGIYTAADDNVIADIDASGKVDSPDLAYIRQVILDIVNDGKVYDVNGDGAVDIRDLVRVKKLSGEA